MIKVCLTKKRMELALKVLAGILMAVDLILLAIALLMRQRGGRSIWIMAEMTMGLWYVAFPVHEVLEAVYGYSKNRLIRNIALIAIGVVLVVLAVVDAVMVPGAFARLWEKVFLGIVLTAVTAWVLYMLIGALRDVHEYRGLCEEFGVPDNLVPFKEYMSRLGG